MVVVMMPGICSSNVWQYLKRSESLLRNPKAFPKAMFEMTSRVKNCALRPKSNSLFSATYFSISRMSNRTFSSMQDSRFSTSLPEYCYRRRSVVYQGVTARAKGSCCLRRGPSSRGARCAVHPLSWTGRCLGWDQSAWRNTSTHACTDCGH